MWLDFFMNYGLFFLKTLTVLVGGALLLSLLIGAVSRPRAPESGHLEVKKLNLRLEADRLALREALLPEAFYHKERKAKRNQEKAEKKVAKKAAAKEEASTADEARVFVLDFKGDLQASAIESLRREITAVLQVANAKDEIVVKLESGGGVVHAYGLAASQLDRIRAAGIPLTVCIDRVAASGGYMMACVADKIVAAPFSVIGSIGVVAQLPNFHRLLKKNDIDVEVLTAGEYKRTLTVFGENTEKGREKFLEELASTHLLFKEFVQERRPSVQIDEVATGEVWYGQRALSAALVDQIATSDEYLTNACAERGVYSVAFVEKRGLPEVLSRAVEGSAVRVLTRLWQLGTRWHI